MRRETRRKSESKKTMYITIGVLFIAILTFIITFIVYSNKLDKELYSFDAEYLAQYTGKDIDVDTATASSSIGKSVEESAKNNSSSSNIIVNNNKNQIKEEKKSNNVNNVDNNTKKAQVIEKDPTFISPIEGEISKEFAKDSLIYSETLKEWTTHLGVDILAERATVVKAASDGIVKDIKNDPRYGLSIIIEHSNGFKTLYANLLTTDFISEGEEVKSGQTIGTVGDSSVYEIVDESHLHFEIIKDGENINPAEYINF